MIRQDLVSWPVSQLPEALRGLVEHARLTPKLDTVPKPTAQTLQHALEHPHELEGLDLWMAQAAQWLQLNLFVSHPSYSDLTDNLSNPLPSIYWIPRLGDPRVVVVLGALGPFVRVYCPENRTQEKTTASPTSPLRWVSRQGLQSLLCEHLEQPYLKRRLSFWDRVSEAEKFKPGKLKTEEKLIQHFLKEQLESFKTVRCWSFGLTQVHSLFWIFQRSQVFQGLLKSIGFSILGSILGLVSWAISAPWTLSGRFDLGLFGGWILFSVSQPLIGWWVGRNQIHLTTEAGALVKQRLLEGTFKLSPEQVVRDGPSRMMSQISDSMALESLVTGGGISIIMSGFNLVVGGVLVSAGLGGRLHLVLYLIWICFSLMTAYQVYLSQSQWMGVGLSHLDSSSGPPLGSRLKISESLMESVLGHRTRQVQDPPLHWHIKEDEQHRKFYQNSRLRDFWAMIQGMILPQGWLIVSLLALVPGFYTEAQNGRAISTVSLALSLGGIMLSQGALSSLGGLFGTVSQLILSWRRIQPTLEAASRAELKGSQRLLFDVKGRRVERTHKNTTESPEPTQVTPVIEGQNVSFKYPTSRDPIIDQALFKVNPGDRILFQSPSGGGKSTLASLLCQIREPSSGKLLLHGLDSRTWGTASWRKRVVYSPQFHENYLFSETLAFNLLMGKRWPPTEEDLIQAQSICEELGLGDLLKKMPAGLQEKVGDTGWRLSHGERARIFLGRALLQSADLMILDENIGTLDPETRKIVLECILKKSKSLLVIAHP